MEEQTKIDEAFMRRCFQLAKLGKGTVSPNPMVGCVLVKKGKIIGEGYHQAFGQAHAEVNALAEVKDKSLLKGATAYVNLEPCAHHGKTPPCAEALVKHGIGRVVIGCLDRNPLVAGKGVQIMEAAGMEIEAGVLEQEARSLNRAFFLPLEHKRPYIVLKWAATADGYIARPNGESKWITGLASRTHTHFVRSQVDAIMVGAGTVVQDNPSLNTRLVNAKSPMRIILDLEGEVTGEEIVFRDSEATMLYGHKRPRGVNSSVSFVKLAKDMDNLPLVLEDLYNKGYFTLLVEGGSKLLHSFVERGLWDEALEYRAKKLFGEGLPAPLIRLLPRKRVQMGVDELSFYRKKPILT